MTFYGEARRTYKKVINIKQLLQFLFSMYFFFSDSVIKVAIVIDSLSKLFALETNINCMLITASVVFQQLNKLTSRYSATSVYFSPRLLSAGSLVISFLIYLFDNNN